MASDNFIFNAILALSACALGVASTGIAFAEQVTDPNFDPHVPRPVFSQTSESALR
jgi:hypothetical protein